MRARAMVTPAERKTWQKLALDVLVERRRFSENAWLPHFTRLRKTIERCRPVLDNLGAELAKDDPDPREVLIWAWCVLMAKPENPAQYYLMIRENSEDGRSFEEEVRALRIRGYAMRGLETSPEMQMLWLGAPVRAIDADLAGLDYWPAERASWMADHWSPTDYPCYVVPVDRNYRAEDGKDRRRRATLYHAIVPRQVGDLAVELVLHPDVDLAGNGRPWRYGSAIFDGMTITAEHLDEDGFRLIDAPLANEEAVVRDQVDQAIATASDVLSWPELTVPRTRLGHIKDALRGDPLANRRRVALTVAGSWHVESDSAWVNRTEILHGRGEPLAFYDKRRVYEYAGRYERIAFGDRLLVIVTEDRLVSVAICKDFCDDVAAKVYDWLGIDLVLVPSMGEANTLAAHRRSAKALQSSQGAVSLLVQQVPVPSGESLAEGMPHAYSFASPPPRGPVAPVPESQSPAFRQLRARR